MSYFNYTDLNSSFLDIKLVDPGSTLINVGACGPISPEIRKLSLRNFVKSFRKQSNRELFV